MTLLRRFLPEAHFSETHHIVMSDYGLVPLRSAEAFAAFREPGVAKLVLNFSTEPVGVATRLSTTTQVYCPDEASRRRMRPCWWLIRPVSGLIRRRILAQVKALAEQSA